MKMKMMKRVLLACALLGVAVPPSLSAQDIEASQEQKLQAKIEKLLAEQEELKARLEVQAAELKAAAGEMHKKHGIQLRLTQEKAFEQAKEAEEKARHALKVLPGIFLDQDDVAQLSKYWIGVHCGPVEEGKGVLVLEVVENSPAKKAGVEKDDVILLIGDSEIADVKQVVELVGKSEGKTIKLQLKRGEENKTIEVTPEERPEQFKVATLDVGEDVAFEVEESMSELLPKIKLPNGKTAIRMKAIHGELPDNFSVSITRNGSGPAKIEIKDGEKTYSVTSDNLDELPEEVRSRLHISMGTMGGKSDGGLGFGIPDGFRVWRFEGDAEGMPEAKNFTFKVEGADGKEKDQLLLYTPKLRPVPGEKIERKIEVVREGEAARIEKLEKQVEEIHAMLKKLTEEKGSSEGK